MRLEIHTGAWEQDAPPRIKQDFVWFGRNWSQEQDMGEPIKELNADDQVLDDHHD